MSYIGLGWACRCCERGGSGRGETDRKTCLFKLEERSKVPEKEVRAKRKRERECGRLIWWVRLVWWSGIGGGRVMPRWFGLERGYGTKKAARSAEDVYYVSRSSQ